MRTKTLILAAVAAFGVGIFTSQAAVTSANIVGYANVTIGNGYNLIANPINVGVSNGANEVFPAIPDNTIFLLWNGSGFTYYDYDSTLGLNGDGSPWYDQNLNESSVPILTPGMGFFVSPGQPMTNTFVGTVAVQVGSTNSMALPSGYSMVASVIPYGGAITNSSVNFPLNDNTIFLQWNGSGYSYYDYDSTLGLNGDGSPWYDANLNEATPPNFKVGEGFFVSPGTPTTWKESISAN